MTSAPERHMIRLDRKPQLFTMRVAALIVRDGRPPAAEILKETI
ncbi:hypothetical protein O8B93_14965 [Agrobacterium rhizogenes]|nr:hypothetical protein [Rhizobium rhizogenes]